MTDVTKTKIIMLKNKGLRPVDIEHEIGVPRETIKTFCKRHYSPPILPTAEEKICVSCGKQFDYRKRKAKYCSDECRQAWWNSHPELVRKKAFYFQKCACCGEEFAAYGVKTRKYCSHKCYIQDRFKGGKNGETNH